MVEVPPGTIVEVVGAGGAAWRPPWAAGGLWGPPFVLAVLIARRAGGMAVIVDTAGEVYPPALAALGLDLGRTAIVRPRGGRREAAWAFAEALAPGTVAVAALEGLGAADARRLQLRAEATGGIGVRIARRLDPV